MLVRTDAAGPVATLTLSRPSRHNALVPELLRDLLTAVGSLPDGTRAVVLAADGRSFSTGGDVRAFAERAEAGDEALAVYADEIVGLLNESVLALLELDVPVVAAVHGQVTGGSLGLVLAADIVLAGPDATFAPWYTVVGFGPDGGWTALLPERIGAARAAAVQLLNETVDASTAVAWGLAHRLVPDAADAARETATALATRRAVPVTKRLLRPDLDALAARLEDERRAFVAQVVTPESRDGMAAFLAGGAA